MTEERQPAIGFLSNDGALPSSAAAKTAPLPRLEAGRPAPLGATFDGAGTNFAVFSSLAERVELCLFDQTGREWRLDLPNKTGDVWHGYVAGTGPGQAYGFRVQGPFNPALGQRANPHKLLLDPYAKAVDGRLKWAHGVWGHSETDAGQADVIDNAALVPRALVVDPSFDWGDDKRPHHSWSETIIYEMHVRGFTKRHPKLAPEQRGTFAALGSDEVISYLKALGVTCVELLPVHQLEDEYFLHQRELTNYWGYNPIAFLAPHNGYAENPKHGAQVTEFKRMVKALHAAGIEVILDVVFNHTAEGQISGPTLSFRGLDNRAYYRHAVGEPAHYVDYTGCGNTVNVPHPAALQLVLDALRYWVLEMRVDGFRFDLGVTLTRGPEAGDAARERHASESASVDMKGAFMRALIHDPVLQAVKLIMEPWDLGPGGYQVGQFPAPCAEWNGKYRDCVRDFWRSTLANPCEFMLRFTGSRDLYKAGGRDPQAGVNFVTAHDGFTLRDLVSYNEKHNLANGENNRDGDSHNRSWNCGIEGNTRDPAVNRLRARQQRNLLGSLLLSQGVPMLLAGDELGRTQRGNNNPYCQDNEISWLDWEQVDQGLLAFARQVIALRHSEPVFRQTEWLEPAEGTGKVVWFGVEGAPINIHRDTRPLLAFACYLNAEGLQRAPHGGTASEGSPSSFLVFFNAGALPVEFALPKGLVPSAWRVELDTFATEQDSNSPALFNPERIEVAAHSLKVYRRLKLAPSL